MLTPILDRNTLKNAHLLTLPLCRVTCPECGHEKGPEEVKFVAEFQKCKACAGLVLKSGHPLVCPECSTIRGEDERWIIKSLGHCEFCSSVPAIYRKEVREGRKTLPSPLPFPNVSCSHCGQDFGPGMHGFSTCESHEGRNPVG